MNNWRGETVTRIRATTTVDGYDNTVSDWSTAAETPMSRVGVAPRSQDEDLDGRTATITGLSLYWRGPEPVDVLPTDRFRVRGTVWEVDGMTADWVSAYTTVRSGVVVHLKQVEG